MFADIYESLVEADESAKSRIMHSVLSSSFEPEFHVDCRNICAEFREDLRFRFSLGLSSLAERLLRQRRGGFYSSGSTANAWTGGYVSFVSVLVESWCGLLRVAFKSCQDLGAYIRHGQMARAGISKFNNLGFVYTHPNESELRCVTTSVQVNNTRTAYFALSSVVKRRSLSWPFRDPFSQKDLSLVCFCNGLVLVRISTQSSNVRKNAFEKFIMLKCLTSEWVNAISPNHVVL